MRLVDETGAQLGVVSIEEARRLASEKNLDLIEVAAKTNPPVVRMADYGKFLYQQAKHERKQKHQKSEVKSIQIKPKTSLHDLQLKATQVKKFIEQGHKVKIEIFLRGRERALRDFAKEKFNNFLLLLGEHKTEGETKSLPSGYMTIIEKKP